MTWQPLSAAQQQFWSGQRLSPDVPLYNMAWRFDIFGALDSARFCQAFVDVARASDAFTAVFAEIDGQVFQRRDAAAVCAPDIVDLSGDAAPEHALQAHAETRVQAPFDLGVCNHRATLFCLGPAHWVWLICQHHIVCDAQSGAALLQAVSAQYDGTDRKHPKPYFEALAGFDQTAPPQTAVAPPQLPWSFYNVREGQGASSGRVAVPLSDAFFDLLDARAASAEYRLFTPDLTRFALYLTGYAAFLSRAMAMPSVQIGVPSHNRLTPAARDTLGLFVEVLPFKVEVAAGESFEAVYGRVKSDLGAFLRIAKPNALRSFGAQSFGAVFNYIQAKFGTFAGFRARVTWCHSGAHDAHHAVRLHVMDFDGSGRPALALDVNDAVLDQISKDQIADNFETLLSGCLRDPQTPIDAVPMMTGPQVSEQMAQAFAGDDSAHAELTVLAQIAGQVEKTPDAIAVSCADVQISYGGLWARATAFGQHLRAAGVAPGDRVVLHMPRGPDYMIAVLGTLMCGGAFVPVAANTPAARAIEVALLAKAGFAVTGGDTNEVFAQTDIVEIHVTQAAPVSGNPLAAVAANSGAYVLFTSGSTGVPKGVCVDHHALARYILWAQSAFRATDCDDYALFSSISFDLTMTSVFAPLCQGGRVVIYPERSDPDLAVLDVFADDAVDVVKLTPAHLSLVCHTPRAVTRIRSLILGGENLSVGLAARAQQVLSPALVIHNEYGPTEAVVGAMVHRFDAAQDRGASVPIGRPAQGVSITLRDAGLNLCPPGVRGEIFIGGRLAQGYDGQEPVRDVAFLDDPKGLQGRIYRTGDFGVLRADGVMNYLGRADGQLKIGGVRVESAEIEAALRRVPAVRDVHIAVTGAGAGLEPKAPAIHCLRCAIGSDYPGITFHDDGVCEICHTFETYKHRADAYFEPPDALAEKLQQAMARSTGAHDVVMLLSGGKDSTYAAYRLAEMSTARVLALTLDNGYISEEAKVNIRRVATHLGWDHRFVETQAMNEIFVDSLKTHSNVCQGCFKTVYTLAMRVARDAGIPAIVTGLSRGQFFETRLTPDLFKAAAPSTAQLDNIVHEARKTYHAQDDAISRLLNTADFKDGSILGEVEIIDLYRYIDVPVSEIFTYLKERTPWLRPSDTGRSTNCLINDVGIYLHRAREGFHNYALPYSWDVRMGHKTRDGALAELSDEIDEKRVLAILDEIGFDEPVGRPVQAPQVAAYVVLEDGADVAELWTALATHLPRAMHPHHIVVLKTLPLTNNGKVARDQLPAPDKRSRSTRGTPKPAETEMQARLVAIFEDVLGEQGIGIEDDFFDLGVESLAAITLAVRANEAGIALPATALFEHRTIVSLAAFSETLDAGAGGGDDADAPLFDMDMDDLDAVAKALS